MVVYALRMRRKEIDLTGTKADKVVRKMVKEAKAITKDGPKCDKCPNRVSRCTCDGA